MFKFLSYDVKPILAPIFKSVARISFAVLGVIFVLAGVLVALCVYSYNQNKYRPPDCDLACAKSLVKEKIPLDNYIEDKYTPLLLAVRGKHLKAVRFLVEHGADVNKGISNSYNPPLNEACKNGDLDIVKYLVEHGANIYWVPPGWKPHADGAQMVLTTANDNNHPEVVKYLLTLGPSLSSRKNDNVEMLRQAAGSGSLDLVKFWMSKNISATEETFYGSPISYASQLGQLDVLKYMIEKGADINKSDSAGQTPLHFAAENGQLKVMRYIIEHGAVVNVSDTSGDTPLMRSVWAQELEASRFLIDRAANINAANKNGDTPLHIASTYGFAELAELLVSRGANPNIKDHSGKTPADVVCSAPGRGKAVPAILTAVPAISRKPSSPRVIPDEMRDYNCPKDKILQLLRGR